VVIDIITAEPRHADTIKSIAEATWWNTYVPIVGREQVRYMLDMFYNSSTLRQQIASVEQYYLLLKENNAVVAFAAFSPIVEDKSIFKLHKLYCLEETRGKGYGKMLVKTVEDSVVASGSLLLELNVNRHNPALNFYKKLGFVIDRIEDIDIGHGYWMNDYVMKKHLSK
jgi:GNAT superfamily N-acetyltransferase